MKKHRVNISRYIIPQNTIYDKVLSSELPIEYQYLLQRYLIKLQPFYLFAKEIIPSDVIVKILKLIYGQYFLWHEECNIESHKSEAEYCMKSLIEKYSLGSYNFDNNVLTEQKYVLYTFANFGHNNDRFDQRGLHIELKENIENLLKCSICAMRKKCKHRNCIILISDTSNYCKKHMRCSNCNCNMRLDDHECAAPSFQPYIQLSLDYSKYHDVDNKLYSDDDK